MIGAGLNSQGIIYFHLLNNYSQLDDSFKRDFDEFQNRTRSIVNSGNKIRPALNEMLGFLFDFNFKAIQWLVKENLDLERELNESNNYFEELTENPKFQILALNILFVFRSNRRVFSALGGHKFISELKEDNIDSVSIPNYDQFIMAITMGVPGETSQVILDFLNSSLYLDFLLVATFIINEENLKVSLNTINQLEIMVADSAQMYVASAMELGLLESSSKNPSHLKGIFSNKYITEQKWLADSGLEDLS